MARSKRLPRPLQRALKARGATLEDIWRIRRDISRFKKPSLNIGAGHGGSVFAWWNLSREQKESLEEQRNLGMFGGIAGHAPYFWVQEGTMVGPGPAQKAGKTPTYFINKSLDAAEAAMADAIAEALNAG